MWPFGFDILIKIFAILWQIVKQIIFFAYILHFWFSFPPLWPKVTWSHLWPVTVLWPKVTWSHLWPVTVFWGSEGSFRIFVNNWKKQRILQDAGSMSSSLQKHSFKPSKALLLDTSCITFWWQKHSFSMTKALLFDDKSTAFWPQKHSSSTPKALLHGFQRYALKVMGQCSVCTGAMRCM